MPPRGPRGALRGHVTVMDGIGAHWTTQNGRERAEEEVPKRTLPAPVRSTKEVGGLRAARVGGYGGLLRKCFMYVM